MATTIRASQLVVETIQSAGHPTVQTSQVVVETIQKDTPAVAVLSQLVVEIVRGYGVPPGVDFPCYPLATAVADLAARLGDPAYVRWTQAELQRYLVESLRTYNAYTQTYRVQVSIGAVINQPFYDLPTLCPIERGYHVTDTDLILDIEYALMEPPTPTVWTGTVQFTLEDIVGALTRRRDQFLRETGAVLQWTRTPLTPVASGRTLMTNDVITIRRAAWIMDDAVTTVPLVRDDTWGLSSYQRTWPQNPASPAERWPSAYATGENPPFTIQIAPVPVDTGTLEMLVIALGTPLTAGENILLGIPDDWTWVVKFGALADLLAQAGLAFDPQRAGYCEARWKQGIELATAASVVLAGRVNNVPVKLTSPSDADRYLRTWETQRATPKYILTAGQNKVGLAPVPSASGTPILLDIIANMPIPDCVNDLVSAALLDTIYDYAEHLALFKEGPTQLETAMALFNRFQRACGITEALDQAAWPNRGPILQQTGQDERVVPREVPPEHND